MLDASFSSANNGAVLAATPCGSGLCAEVLVTADAGRHFQTMVATGIAAPGPDAGCPKVGTCVSRIVMVNASHGFVFDPSLAETVDGGRTWRTTAGGASDLTANSGAIFRVKVPSPECVGSQSTLQRRAPGGGSWSDVAVATPDRICPSKLLAGTPNVVALVGYGNPAGSYPRAAIMLSVDRGLHWRGVDDVCPGQDGYAQHVAVSAADRIVELCVHQQVAAGGVLEVTIAVSDDGGRNFSHRPVPQTRAVDSVDIDVVDQGQRILLDEHGPHGDDVELSTDRGAHWKDVLQTEPTQPSRLLGFSGPLATSVIQDGTNGVVVYTSVDGGTTWTSSANRS